MANSCSFPALLLLLLLLLLASATTSAGNDTDTSRLKCDAVGLVGKCHNKPEALRLKIIALASILVASFIGICLPLLSRFIPALRQESKLLVIAKAFSSGVILATGYMHVMPDSYNDLTSPCLPKKPWREFPFTGFVAMLSAVFALMVDTLMLTFYNRRRKTGTTAVANDENTNHDMPVPHGNGHGHCGAPRLDLESKGGQETVLLRNRIIAQMLEMGIIVHSVVIGLSMGSSHNTCTIRPLVAAICFHQLFEGMGLGGCILQAEYGVKMKSILAFFYATTTPFGIILGIGLSNVYTENGPTALIVVGLLNASSAGLLNYMALVDLLAYDFMGSRLQGDLRLQLWAYVAVLLGIGGMSFLAIWA